MYLRVVFSLILLLATPGLLLSQADEPVITVESNLVVLNATITDIEGRPVLGLTRDRFSVFEDGVEQKIEFFSSDETPFAAVILLDTSGSMESRISMARSAAIRFLAGLRPGDMAAIYKFDSKVELIQNFSEMRDVDEKLFDTKAYGMTAMYDAIVKASEALSARAEKRRAIIVLSDGADTSSSKSSDAALRAALRADAAIYTVDMSSADGGRRVQNAAALRTFAEKTGGRFVSTPGGAAMRSAFEDIVKELGNQYTIAYDPINTIKDGKWRDLELRVGRKNLIVRTRKGYNAPKNPKGSQ